MGKTAVVSSPIFTKHIPGRGHPESSQRVTAIVREMEKKARFDSRLELVQPEKASLENVELVHAPEYIKLVEAVCKAGGGPLDSQDTVASSSSFEVALYAVGGTMKAVDLVMERKFENAFALVRPPGHHAERFRALGFCIFNNVAIAAQYLVEKFNLNRVLVLDVDAHHGNGTQKRFYETSDVLYISLHEDPTDFPGTGFIHEVGKGKGLGFNVNVPFPHGTGDSIYLRAFEEIVTPIVRQYEPEFILVSAGFDSHHLDPVGNLSLSARCIQQVFESIADLASRICEGKLVSVLEGGYNLRTIGRLAIMAIPKIEESPLSREKEITTRKKSLVSRDERVIKETKKVQRAFWDLR